MTRRTWLNLAINGAGLVIASVFVLPALVSALSPALRGRRPSTWRALGRLGSFPLGQVTEGVVTPDAKARFGKSPARGVYVWRNSPAETVVFSRACTDLGCPVKYDPGSEFYYCPCHGGIFDKAGEPVAGPPAHPLPRYATRVRGEILEIDVASVSLVA